MSAVLYRRAVLADVEQLIALRLAMHEEIGKSGDDPARLRAYFERTIASEVFIGWLACEGERTVACSGLVLYDPPAGKTAYLMNMYTVPSHRGRGVAGELVRRQLDEAHARGAVWIRLRAEPKARPVYERAGFLARANEMERRVQ